MHFSAVIRCLPLDPGYAVDIGVLRHGGPHTLGLVLADICSGIVSGQGGMNVVLREKNTQLRYTDAPGLAALIQGGIVSAMETLLEYQVHFTGNTSGSAHPRSNLFVLRAADDIGPLADFLYTVELRRFPSDFHGEQSEVLRPWITVHGADGLSGWPDDILMVITEAGGDMPA